MTDFKGIIGIGTFSYIQVKMGIALKMSENIGKSIDAETTIDAVII